MSFGETREEMRAGLRAEIVQVPLTSERLEQIRESVGQCHGCDGTGVDDDPDYDYPELCSGCGEMRQLLAEVDYWRKQAGVDQ